MYTVAKGPTNLLQKSRLGKQYFIFEISQINLDL